MARTNLPVTNMVEEGAVVAPAGTAIDPVNGMNIVLASGAIPAAPGAWDLFIQYNGTFAGAKNIYIRAGANPPSSRAGKGDLVQSVNNQTVYIGPLEPARHEQADGSINVDFDASSTGTILAFLRPHLV